MEAGAEFEARSEALVFLGFFADFPDPRQPGKVIYPLEEVFLLCLLAVLAGAETVVDIARFGQKKIELLRRFLPFRDGTPSHDQLGDILATLDATEFQRRFVAWVAKLISVSADVIAIDGKTSRRSADKGEERQRSTWCPLSQRASVWCSAKSKWRTNPTRSSPSLRFSICWRSRAPSSPSMRWAAGMRSPGKSSTRRLTNMTVS
jgi:hypothetical protein